MRRRYKIPGTIAGLMSAALVATALLLSHDAPCGHERAAFSGGAAMKAAVYRCYGGPEVVRLEEMAKPAGVDDRVLVRVKAASVNPLDWHYLRGKPYFMRALGAGWGVPDDIRLGVDFAGTVESVGKDVTRFKPGDDVFGGADGSFATYVSVREHGSIASKPPELSFAEAAAVPIAAATALQALRDKGRIQPGQHVLINGASGGVGTFAVQLAKALGGEVTAVCSTKNLELMRSIGANHVIDYTREDFTHAAGRYDLIIDIVSTHSLSETRRVLNPRGALVIVGGVDDGSWGTAFLWRFMEAKALAPFLKQRVEFFLAHLDADSLDELRGLMQAGKLRSVIDRTYALAEVPAALAYLERGHARGKVVIAVD